MAEWLGTGLQNQVQQFDSAWHLIKKAHSDVSFFYEVPSGFSTFANISFALGGVWEHAYGRRAALGRRISLRLPVAKDSALLVFVWRSSTSSLA